MISKFQKALNIVTAYTETGISLYQETVYQKTNEIPTVQSMLELINVKDKVITADALHCQKETAKAIVENGGDYVLQLKGNQKRMYEDFDAVFDEKQVNKEDFEIYETIEKSHGRIETRKYVRIRDKEYYKNGYFDEYFKKWSNLNDIISVTRTVEKNGKITKEKSIYITSLDSELSKIAKSIRNHWCIESMHHILDVTFNEDKCYLGSKNAQENMNILRKFSVMIHKHYKEENEKNGKKVKSIRNNMFLCLINEEHLLEVINFAQSKYTNS